MVERLMASPAISNDYYVQRHESPVVDAATGVQRAPWTDAVGRALRRLQELPPGWDSYGGHRIQERAVYSAVNILSAIAADPHLPQPSIVPTSVGGIQIEWHRLGVDLELEISPSGSSFEMFVSEGAVVRELSLSNNLAPFAAEVRRLADREAQAVR